MFLFRRSSLMATTVYGRSLAPISKHYFKQKNNNTYPESLNSLQEQQKLKRLEDKFVESEKKYAEEESEYLEHRGVPFYLTYGQMSLSVPAFYIYGKLLASEYFTPEFYNLLSLCTDYSSILSAVTAGLLFSFSFVNQKNKAPKHTLLQKCSPILILGGYVSMELSNEISLVTVLPTYGAFFVSLYAVFVTTRDEAFPKFIFDFIIRFSELIGLHLMVIAMFCYNFINYEHNLRIELNGYNEASEKEEAKIK